MEKLNCDAFPRSISADPVGSSASKMALQHIQELRKGGQAFVPSFQPVIRYGLPLEGVFGQGVFLTQQAIPKKKFSHEPSAGNNPYSFSP